MGYFSRTKKSCISVFYICTKFQSSPYNNKHFRILGGTVPLILSYTLAIFRTQKLDASATAKNRFQILNLHSKKHKYIKKKTWS